MSTCPSKIELEQYYCGNLNERDPAKFAEIQAHLNGPHACPDCNSVIECLKEVSDEARLQRQGTEADSQPPLQPGSRFAGCELEECLGRGGMGEVWKGRQLTTEPSRHRAVAIKVIRDDLLEGHLGELFKHRFKTEIGAAAELEHDHIVRVYKWDEEDGRLYYIMQFIHGTDAGDFIRRFSPTRTHGRVSSSVDPEHSEGTSSRRDDGGQARPPSYAGPPTRTVARIMRQVAEAVGYAHSRPILHRDIKPSNILIEQNDRVSYRAYVSDFGLAKVLQDEESASGGQHHGTPAGHQTQGELGTRGYMAPEQASDASKATALSDIYSLGATLFAMLTGQPPRHAANSLQGIRQVQIGDLKLMSDVADTDSIPTQGRNLVIVADVEDVLHFRIFDSAGERVADTDETRLLDKVSQIAKLESLLVGLWRRPEISRSDEVEVIDAVTSIVNSAEIKQKIDPDLESICLKCLQQDPAKRYATTKDMVEDLTRFLRDEPAGVRPRVTPFERTWRWCRRKPLVAAMVSISAAALLIFVGFLWQSGEANRARAAELGAQVAKEEAEPPRCRCRTGEVGANARQPCRQG